MIKKSIPWIALGVALIAVVFTLLCYFNIIPPPSPNKYCLNDNHSDTIGIIISTVALVVSIYFVIIGLHARTIKKEFEDDIKGFYKEIKKTKDNFDDEVTSLKNMQIELSKNAAQDAKNIYEQYSRSIEIFKIEYNNLPTPKRTKTKILYKNNYKEYNDNIKLARSRFVCKTSRFHELGIVLEAINIIKKKSADKDDVDLLDKVIFDSQNNIDIINAARFAQKEIMKRLG